MSMRNEAQAELRVFSGIHAGARARLAPGVHVLGSAAECDLIVCDAGVEPRHLELHVEAQGCFVHPLHDCVGVPPEGTALAPGAGITLGTVILTVDAANAPWLYAETPATRRPPNAPAQIEIRPDATPAEPYLDEKVAQAPTPFRAGAPGSPPRGWSRRPIVVLSALLALGVPLAWWWSMRGADAQDSAPLPAIGTPDVDARRAQINDILQQLELSQVASLEQRPDGTLSVKAALLSDDEYEALAAALARLNPRPGLQVESEEALIDALREALATHYPDVHAEYLGGGRFRLSGQVASDAERDALPARLATEFPALRGVENAVLAPATMAEQLLDRLREAGFVPRGSEWLDGVFAVAIEIPPQQLPTLQRLLLRAETDYGRWLKFSVRVVDRKATEKNAHASLPFRIRGVVGGATPYVVLPDNTKVVPGGRIGAWRLVDIGPDSLVFDGPRRIVVDR